jgi:hypothetical protein
MPNTLHIGGNMDAGLHNDHRGATEALIAHVAGTQPGGPLGGTVVGVDECVAQEPVQRAVHRLIVNGVVDMTFPLWTELRQRANGEIFAGMGAPGDGVVDGHDWGRRLRGDSYPDDHVAAIAIAYLYHQRRVVVLTANRRGDRGGLRQLFRQEVAPVLNENSVHGRSLVLLLQRPRTTIQGYADRVLILLPAMDSPIGFQELIV